MPVACSDCARRDAQELSDDRKGREECARLVAQELSYDRKGREESAQRIRV